jgi:pseudaminic acid cytidylyltransferase
MNLAIIPARGGSQRISRKNIRDFLGKPILEYSINSALDSNCFDEVIVSTDDEEIAKIAISCGASVPFFRSKINSSNTATTIDVLVEVLMRYKEENVNWENLCCIYPTAPFISPERLIEGLNILKNNSNIKSVIPVVKFSHPIQRAIKLDDGFITFLYPDNSFQRTQDFEDRFHDSGQFYWLDSDFFLNTKKIFTKFSKSLIIPESEVQDIDNEEDWILAELKFKALNL